MFTKCAGEPPPRGEVCHGAYVMTLLVFDTHDAPFLQWMSEHPDGYVVNTERRPNSRLFFLHTANCFHIAGYVSGQQPDAFTGRDYIKVCSDDASELLAWAQMHRPNIAGFTSLCQTCHPDPLALPNMYPDQVDEDHVYIEGAVRTVSVNAYERNPAARRKCIEAWGTKCSVCELEFEQCYGPIGTGFIHVHHLRPLSAIGEAYTLDPIRDLRPVCPNCHAMLHRKTPPYTIDELKVLLRATEDPKVDEGMQ